jgi:hypothetical protein
MLEVELVEAFEGLERRGQKLFFSGGEGLSLSAITHLKRTASIPVDKPHYHSQL